MGSKIGKKTLQHRPGHPKGRQETPEASGTPFWTLRATILDPPGVDFGPPGGMILSNSGDRFSIPRGTFLFHAFGCRHRLYRLSTYLAACRCCFLASQVLWVGGCPR